MYVYAILKTQVSCNWAFDFYIKIESASGFYLFENMIYIWITIWHKIIKEITDLF